MNAGALLALIADLYAQLQQALARADALEAAERARQEAEKPPEVAPGA